MLNIGSEISFFRDLITTSLFFRGTWRYFIFLFALPFYSAYDGQGLGAKR